MMMMIYSPGGNQEQPLREGWSAQGGGGAAKADAVRPDDHLPGRSSGLESHSRRRKLASEPHTIFLKKTGQPVNFQLPDYPCESYGDSRDLNILIWELTSSPLYKP
jgi:hypothetical protein